MDLINERGLINVTQNAKLAEKNSLLTLDRNTGKEFTLISS